MISLNPLACRAVLMTGLLLLPVSVFAQGDGAAEPKPAEPAAKPDPATVKKNASYAIGVQIGADLKRSGAGLDPQMIAKGLVDSATGAKLQMTEEQMQEVMTQFQTMMREKAMAEAEAAAQEAKKEVAAIMAANKKKEGVKETASGLQYSVIKQGTGAKPKATDTVKVHYHGTLPDGTVFDSSVDRGQPAQFPVGGVIKGWVEALQLMPVGSKYKLVIPPDLAYGERGAGRDIGPNQVLIFEVELLDIVTK